MLTLLTFPGSFGQPSHSPFCMKAMGLLNLAGVAWQPEYHDDPRKMPLGRLPVLRAPGALVPDSGAIQAYLEAQGANLWGGADARARARGHLCLRLAEESLHLALVHERWLDERCWPEVRETFFAAMPALPRRIVPAMLRAKLRKKLTAQGFAQFDTAGRVARIEADFDALEAVLGDGPYVLGAAPTPADMAVVPFLAMLSTLPAATETREALRARGRLMAYVARCAELFAVPQSVAPRQAA